MCIALLCCKVYLFNTSTDRWNNRLQNPIHMHTHVHYQTGMLCNIQLQIRGALPIYIHAYATWGLTVGRRASSPPYVAAPWCISRRSWHRCRWDNRPRTQTTDLCNIKHTDLFKSILEHCMTKRLAYVEAIIWPVYWYIQAPLCTCDVNDSCAPDADKRRIVSQWHHQAETQVPHVVHAGMRLRGPVH